MTRIAGRAKDSVHEATIQKAVLSDRPCSSFSKPRPTWMLPDLSSTGGTTPTPHRRPVEMNIKPAIPARKILAASCSGVCMPSTKEAGHKFWYRDPSYSAAGRRYVRMVLDKVAGCWGRPVDLQCTPFQLLNAFLPSPIKGVIFLWLAVLKDSGISGQKSE